MRFILGLLIGLGIGFVVAILFAPEKKEDGGFKWPGAERKDGETPKEGPEARVTESLQRAVKRLREQVDEAMSEARQAAQDAEKEMEERFHRTVKRHNSAD
jgi:gas vesicle protein